MQYRLNFDEEPEYPIDIIEESTKITKCKLRTTGQIFWVPNKQITVDGILTEDGIETVLKQYEEFYNE